LPEKRNTTAEEEKIMKKSFILFLILIFALAFNSSCRPAANMTIESPPAHSPSSGATDIASEGSPITEPEVSVTISEDVKKLAKGNNEFAIDLYKKVSSDSDGNLFFSPSSISTALGMTYGGTKGETKSQFEKVLHFTLGQDKTHREFAVLINLLKKEGSKKGCQLNIANRLWGGKGFKFLDSFLNITAKYYGAKLEELDFKDTEKARKTINAWVEKETRNKIKDLIQPGVLFPDTRLVLTNAIYFKADWELKFKKERTKDGVFNVDKDKKVTVPMMTQRSDFKYGEFGNLKILEMPYIGKDFSMIILLPSKVDGVTELDKSLSLENLENWISKLYLEEITVYLPRFKMTSGFELSKILKSLGMTDAFDNKADFSGMTGTKELNISAVIHKAFVAVDEEGSEAAASTAVVMAPKGIAVSKEFRADHPFIFLIRENKTGSILFMGRMMNPAEDK